MWKLSQVKFHSITYYCIILGELVKDLKSSDVELQQKAMKEADCCIAAFDEPCTTKVNRTTINTNPPLQSSLVKTCIQGHQHTLALLFLHSVSLSLSHFVCAPVCLALLLALSIKDIQYETNNLLLFCLSSWAAWWIHFTQNWDHSFVSRLSNIFFSVYYTFWKKNLN